MEDSPSTLRMWIILVYDQSSIKMFRMFAKMLQFISSYPLKWKRDHLQDLLNGYPQFDGWYLFPSKKRLQQKGIYTIFRRSQIYQISPGVYFCSSIPFIHHSISLQSHHSSPRKITVHHKIPIVTNKFHTIEPPWNPWRNHDWLVVDLPIWKI